MESIIKKKGLDINRFAANIEVPATSANSAGYFTTQVPGWDGTNKKVLQITLQTSQISSSNGRVLWPASLSPNGTLYVIYNSKNAVSAMGISDNAALILYIDT